MDKSRRQRLKQLVIMILSRGCERCDGSSVEAVFKGHDGIKIASLLFRRILASRLDSALVCLSTRVAEKRPTHACAGTKQFRELGTRLCIVKIGHMLNAGKLSGDRPDPRIVGDAEGGHADTRPHVNITLTCVVVYIRTLTRHDLHGKPCVGVHDVGSIFRLKFAHVSPP